MPEFRNALAAHAWNHVNAEKGRQCIAKQRTATKPGRVPRIARLMALAIHCDQLIRDGVVADQTALAKRLNVSQPRMTQIMNLTQLAPDVQEALLFLPPTDSGREAIHEKMLRPIVAELDWNEQRRLWTALSVTNHCFE